MHDSPGRTDDVSRRRLLLGAGVGAGGAVAAVLAACGGDGDPSGPGQAGEGDADVTNPSAVEKARAGRTDLEIVNHLLRLEHVTADFYEQVVASGRLKDRKLAATVREIGDHEQEHAATLEAIARRIGTPARRPQTTFDDVLAGGRATILATAATLENLGAAAYLGQLTAIASDELLAVVLSIHSVEARHAAALNELAGRGFAGGGALQGSIPDGAFAAPMARGEVLEQIEPFTT